MQMVESNYKSLPIKGEVSQGDGEGLFPMCGCFAFVITFIVLPILFGLAVVGLDTIINKF